MPDINQDLSTFDERMAPLSGSTTPMLWHIPNKATFRLSGFAWYDQDGLYRRLPVACDPEIPEGVNLLANSTAGGQIAFRSDSNQVAIRVQLAGPSGMHHMPATGQSGFDLYIGPPCAQRFHKTATFVPARTSYEVLLFDHPDKEMREFRLNFPLYQGVKRVQVGLLPDAAAEAPSPWSTEGRIIFYGTSITQGGCASRPGMAYTNILSRALNMEVINLGFSGNGRGEPEVLQLMADVPDPALLVLDYEANAGGTMLEKTLPEAIRILRDKHACVPLLVVSRVPFAADASHATSLQARERSRDMQANLIGELRRKGDDNIYFFDGSVLFGEDFDECTVDGVHPTDLGFMRMASGLDPEIRRIFNVG